MVTALRRIGFSALVLLGAVLLLLVVVTPLGLRAQLLLGVGAFAAALVLGMLSRGRVVTLSLVLVSLTVSTRYLFWRLTVTLKPEFTLASCAGWILLAAELYAYAMLVLGYLQLLGRLPRKPVPLPSSTARWPTVDVFIPTYSEPLRWCATTVLAAKALDWPSDKLRDLPPRRRAPRRLPLLRRRRRDRLHGAARQQARQGRQPEPRARPAPAASSSPSSTAITSRPARSCSSAWAGSSATGAWR